MFGKRYWAKANAFFNEFVMIMAMVG